jgi:hypothetical protein
MLTKLFAGSVLALGLLFAGASAAPKGQDCCALNLGLLQTAKRLLPGGREARLLCPGNEVLRRDARLLRGRAEMLQRRIEVLRCGEGLLRAGQEGQPRRLTAGCIG